MSTQTATYLHDLRSQNSLTIEQLAEESGYSAAYVTQIEQGEQLPDLHCLWKLTIALNGDYWTSLYYLCLDSGVPEEEALEVKKGLSKGAMDKILCDIEEPGI